MKIILVIIASISVLISKDNKDYKFEFENALKKAKFEHKALYVFMTTSWCGPCKALEKYIFPADTIQHYFKNDFELVKINAESDFGIVLSKKYSVRSYPTMIILDHNLNYYGQDRGYSGDTMRYVTKLERFKKDFYDRNYIKGYSSNINISYPEFYENNFQKKPKNPSNSELNEFYSNYDKFSEEYFAVMQFFGLEGKHLDFYLDNHQRYVDLFGKDNNLNLAFLLANNLSRKFATSAQANDFENEFRKFKNVLDENYQQMLYNCKEYLYKETKDWQSLVELYQEFVDKNNYETINNICWYFYEENIYGEVLEKPIKWMENVISTTEVWYYYDTFAALLYNHGDYIKSKKFAMKAIKLAEKENTKATESIDLLGRINYALKHSE
jgi:thioredoxin-related protein